MHDLVNYMLVVYHPQILNAVDIGHLPAKIQFAYYMKQAEEFKAQGDKSNYLKELNKALISYGVMKPYIKLILEAFEREEEQTSEFKQYVKLIKQKIEELLALGQKQQVKEILRSLEQMIPNDRDVIRYKKHLER